MLKPLFSSLSAVFLTLSLSACQSSESQSSEPKQSDMNSMAKEHDMHNMAKSTLSETQDDPAHDHSMHKHEGVEATRFDANAAIPSVTLNVQADSMSGWNVQINTQHFTFAPDKAGLADTQNEGHAHLYVDGYKFARVYGNWYHLKALTPGKHYITVTLNTNDHKGLEHKGEKILATKMIVQK